MLEHAHVVISIDPSTGAAVVSVVGPLPAQAAGMVRQALRSASAIAGPAAISAHLASAEDAGPHVDGLHVAGPHVAGPHVAGLHVDESDLGGHHPAGPRVVVDLQACTLLHPVVAECLMDEHERIRGRGGAVVCEGTAYPATTTAVPDLAITLAGTSVTDAARALDVVEAVGPAPVAVLADASTTPSADEPPRARLVDLDDAELDDRTRQATRRRTVAVDEPERSASGRLLMALLTEHARRVAAVPPGRPGRAVTGRPSSR